jgi:hypothetical protein
LLTLIETRKSKDKHLTHENDYELKIPYMQTFRFIKVSFEFLKIFQIARKIKELKDFKKNFL